MQVFLIQVLDFPNARLDPDETRHAVKVLRHEAGDIIYCTEGKGVMYKARIVQISKTEGQLEILESMEQYGEHTGHVRLAVSPLRLKDRFEWLIEKAVELGVNEIQPLQCERTDPYKAKFKAERLHTLMLTALKQCKRSSLPLLNDLEPFSDWIQRPLSGSKWIGWCEAQDPVQTFQSSISSSPEVNLLIGPEGDFTELEVQMAQEAGFIPVSLGENRLRTETAGIYALSLIKGWWAY